MFGSVVAHCVEKSVCHVGLEANSLWLASQLKQLVHVLPAMHATPTDLALGGETLAITLCDGSSFFECLCDLFLIASRILSPS